MSRGRVVDAAWAACNTGQVLTVIVGLTGSCDCDLPHVKATGCDRRKRYLAGLVSPAYVQEWLTRVLIVPARS
jgi:hypothetical protein